MAAIIGGVMAFIGCRKDFVEPLAYNNDGIEESILGRKLENPYSVKNMRIAYNNLQKGEKNKKNSLDINATHYYVKFKPANDEELSLLKLDSTLDLYDYPMDHEVVPEQDAYHDPSVPEGKPTYQYCAVKVSYNFPEIEYEILEDLFIPEATTQLKSNESFVEELVDEALRITGNLKETENDKRTKGLLPSKWRPAGRILVWDDNIGTTTTTTRIFSHWEYYDCGGTDPIQQQSLTTLKKPIEDNRCKRAVYRYVTTTINGSYVPVQGVIVRARRFFVTHKDDTDANGYYSCDGQFRYDANYSIIWERYEFEIRKSLLGRAKYDGPKKRGDWNLNIKGGTQEYYATIFRPAFHYTYGNIKGLRRPPQNGFWKVQLKLRAFYENNGSANGEHNPVRGWVGIGSAIHIFNPQHDSRDIYGTVIHEMAHASHWNMSALGYAASQDIVAESWARGVQWELTRMVYHNYSGGPTIRPNYTQVVVDMIDGVNDRNNGSEILAEDNVSGYTIRQIEDALGGNWRWDQWRDKIKKLYNNGTENNLDALFAHWD